MGIIANLSLWLKLLKYKENKKICMYFFVCFWSYLQKYAFKYNELHEGIIRKALFCINVKNPYRIRRR